MSFVTLEQRLSTYPLVVCVLLENLQKFGATTVLYRLEFSNTEIFMVFEAPTKIYPEHYLTTSVCSIFHVLRTVQNVGPKYLDYTVSLCRGS